MSDDNEDEIQKGLDVNNEPRDSNDDIMAALKEVLEAKTQDDKIEHLTTFVFGFAASMIKRVRSLRARLPFPPWLVKTLGGVTLVGIIGIAAWLVRMDARACTADTNAREAKATATENYDKLDNRLRPAENGIVKLLADMDNLRAARGVAPSTPMQQYRVRVKLGLPLDSVPIDSVPPPGKTK